MEKNGQEAKNNVTSLEQPEDSSQLEHPPVDNEQTDCSCAAAGSLPPDTIPAYQPDKGSAEDTVQPSEAYAEAQGHMRRIQQGAAAACRVSKATHLSNPLSFVDADALWRSVAQLQARSRQQASNGLQQGEAVVRQASADDASALDLKQVPSVCPMSMALRLPRLSAVYDPLRSCGSSRGGGAT